ncbi:uncharacterized protein LOC110464672 [Mizuhopecten yessoensis]|uniref:Ankyrin repeat domain-containing protein 32 n=1 Tax=Mizuhopecten yessoensis TaxID=6573 RepID=A0A210PTF3_MIZYE|nr:uncharacterized protein LOC110464672 [Mizuhopecten yessoensis]OWF39735.1 Ankyrin repeat domain-containing protein 32 [Mizuhopecten yessoensis]
MSRGVRDLRELICVSRLTFRNSDDEEPQFLTDDEVVAKDFDRLSVSSSDSVGGVEATNGGRHISPDSGCVTNGSTPPELPMEEDTTLSTTPIIVKSPPVPTKVGRTRRKKKRAPHKVLSTEPSRHELPKPPRIPPLRPRYKTSNSSDNDSDVDMESCPVQRYGSHVTGFRKTQAEGNFDDILCYMDATVVSNWLERANKMVTEITAYCNSDDSFVTFAHFWFTGFDDIQKIELFDLEHSILVEEMSFAFAVGKDQGKVNQRDLNNFISALFREYPDKLLSTKGPNMFLNHLDVLSSQKHVQYKKLLSDVKCSTKNKQYAQWILATRSFALVSVWSAVVNFYRNLLEKISPSRPPSSQSHREEDTNLRRIGQAIRLGFADVVHYYFTEGHIKPHLVDPNGRTFVFSAVMYNQCGVLHYLINRVKPMIDVNLAADTGNTPLHAAANSGNDRLVEVLLQCPQINVNAINPQCENATPLHLAVMHGHRTVVEKLVKAKADLSLKMGELNAEDIAKQFDSYATLRVLKDSV